MTKHERFLDRALSEMFRAVGRCYRHEVTAQPDWYKTSSWTWARETSFRDWLAHELMKTFHIRKKRALFQAGMFLLFYGWTLQEEPQEVAPKIREHVGAANQRLAKEKR